MSSTPLRYSVTTVAAAAFASFVLGHALPHGTLGDGFALAVAVVYLITYALILRRWYGSGWVSKAQCDHTHAADLQAVLEADRHRDEAWAEVGRLRANLAAIRCEIDARRDCADLKTIRHYADEATDMRPATLMAEPSPRDPSGDLS